MYAVVKYSIIVLDASEAIQRTDIIPNRLVVLRDSLCTFVEQYLWSHALSFVGVVETRNGLSNVVCAPTISPETIKASIRTFCDEMRPGGSPSIENALGEVMTLLHDVPRGARKEIIYISNSLHTCDPSDVFAVIQRMSNTENLFVNVVSFGGHMHVLSQLATRCRGLHYVPRNERDLSEILHKLVTVESMEGG
eukprot:PhF_6_TR4983/c0_g1_i1/m.7056/K03142/TFIIH2, GTF2H2, SSL1; transcription initiation factor TFIIH subunit 2